MTTSGPPPYSPGPSDAELLEAHLAGDHDAFGELFARHRDRLWAVALRTTGDPEEAADALQDALVSAFRRAGSFRGDAAVTTWLHRIVVNACLDRLRRRKVRAADPLPEYDESGGRDPDPRSSAADPATWDPTQIVVDAERRQQVLDALATLPAEQRAALVLVDMEGYPVEEAARILECAPGTVKSRCSRGRARLLPLLRPLASPGTVTDPTSTTAHRRNPGTVTSVPSADTQPEGGEHR